METIASEQKKNKRLPRPNNVITVPIEDSTDFFKWWCIFLRPFIKLTDREIDIVASFLKQRWELSKRISDPSLLDSMMLSENVRTKVQEECHITSKHLYVVISNLRKSKVFINNTINPRLIPNIRKDDNGYFQLLILFKGERK